MSDDIQKVREIQNSLSEISDDGREVVVEEPEEDDYDPYDFTLEKQKEFLEAFAQSGNISKSAAKVGIDRKTVYLAKEKSERFNQLFEEAKEISYDTLEAEAWDRALNGRATYEKFDAETGKKIEERTEYFEKTLITLLEAHKPEKFDRKDKEAAVGPINIEITPQDKPKEIEPE